MDLQVFDSLLEANPWQRMITGFSLSPEGLVMTAASFCPWEFWKKSFFSIIKLYTPRISFDYHYTGSSIIIRMKGKFWLKLASFLLGLITIPLGILIWPPHPEIIPPTPQQLPFFIGVAVIEAIAFGYGYYFLIEGYRLLKEKKTRLNYVTYLSIAWLLMSWWPHDRLHTHIGEEAWGLLALEYSFHATSIAAATVVALFFYKELKMGKANPSLVELGNEKAP
jgi:uncharacterized membrane protein